MFKDGLLNEGHKIFKKAISTLKPELEQESLKEFPAVLEDLNNRLPSQ